MVKLLFLIVLLSSFATKLLAQAPALTFGVVPQQSAKQLAALWTPILTHISQQSGVNIEFSTAKDIPTFEQRLAAGKYDIAYMNPYHYVVSHAEVGYMAIAKQSNKTIQGIIVAPRKGEVTSINDLQGARLAFPAPAAFAATILPQAELKRLGITFTPTYVGSHDSVYLNIAKGFFPAGGGIQRTLNNMSVETKSQLRIIWKSAKFTSHAIASHPRVNDDSRNKIVAILVSMSDNELGRQLLKTINFNGFESATNADWDDVRALQIDTLIMAK